jgi:hypothetical protein
METIKPKLDSLQNTAVRFAPKNRMLTHGSSDLGLLDPE